MPPTDTIKPLTKEEKAKLKELKALEEQQKAYEDAQDELKQERETKVRTVDDLFAEMDTRIARSVKSEIEKATGDFRGDFSKLTDTINSLVEDINTLGKKEHDSKGGGIGYDHASAVEEQQRTGNSGKGVFKVGRATVGFLTGWDGPYEKCIEREMLEGFYKANNMRTKALQMGVSSAGGFMIPPQWMAEVIELLRPNLVSRSLGARFRVLDGPTTYRKLQGGATSYWTAEGRKLTQSQQTFGRINLTPKPLVTSVPISEDLLEMAPGSLQMDIEEDMGKSQAEALDLAIMKGDGGEGEPLGIVNLAGGTTDFGSADYGTTAQNITDLLDDLIYSIGARKVTGSVGFAVAPGGIQKLRTVKDLQGQPLLFDPGIRGGQNPQSPNGGVEMGTLWGRPYATSTQLSYGTTEDDLIAAVWSEIMVAGFGLTQIRPSYDASDPATGDSAYMSREVWIRMTSKWDAALRHNQAVQIATGWDNA